LEKRAFFFLGGCFFFLRKAGAGSKDSAMTTRSNLLALEKLDTPVILQRGLMN